jgi:hypothetical protein
MKLKIAERRSSIVLSFRGYKNAGKTIMDSAPINFAAL